MQPTTMERRTVSQGVCICKTPQLIHIFVQIHCEREGKRNSILKLNMENFSNLPSDTHPEWIATGISSECLKSENFDPTANVHVTTVIVQRCREEVDPCTPQALDGSPPILVNSNWLATMIWVAQLGEHWEFSDFGESLQIPVVIHPKGEFMFLFFCKCYTFFIFHSKLSQFAQFPCKYACVKKSCWIIMIATKHEVTSTPVPESLKNIWNPESLRLDQSADFFS